MSPAFSSTYWHDSLSYLFSITYWVPAHGEIHAPFVFNNLPALNVRKKNLFLYLPHAAHNSFNSFRFIMLGNRLGPKNFLDSELISFSLNNILAFVVADIESRFEGAGMRPIFSTQRPLLSDSSLHVITTFVKHKKRLLNTFGGLRQKVRQKI